MEGFTSKATIGWLEMWFSNTCVACVGEGLGSILYIK